MKDLREMFNIQKTFTKDMEKRVNNIDIDDLSYSERCNILKDYSYSTIEEVVEFVRKLETKRHKRKVRTDFDHEKTLDELVDVFKFWMNLIIISGFTIDEFIAQWEKKTKIVSDRLKKEDL